MPRDGILDHLQHGDFPQDGLRARHIHKSGTELFQQGLAGHSVQQHGRMGLRKLLRRREYRNIKLHGIREFGREEGGLQGEGARIGGRYREAPGFHLAGLHRHGKLLHTVPGPQLQRTGDGNIGH